VLPNLNVLQRLHAGFDDPPRLALDARDEDEAIGIYRRVRDEIRTFVETLPQRLALSSRADTRTDEVSVSLAGQHSKGVRGHDERY
jgi:hypothetical protein